MPCLLNRTKLVLSGKVTGGNPGVFTGGLSFFSWQRIKLYFTKVKSVKIPKICLSWQLGK